MSDSSSDQDDNKTNGKRKSPSTMFMYIREVLFVLALAITSYATLFNSLPKVGKPPPAIPFFPASSVVQDYYRGTMAGAFEQASQSDIAVVMFYAPWDAESQAARPVFDAVARFLRDEVYFAAVSCWAPTSECRHHYPKIRSFPVLVVYPQQGPGIQYKGPIVTGHLVRFIRSMIRPIHRIHSLYDVAALFKSYDAVVVGSFDFEGNLGGVGYYTFYSSAMKMLEKDFNHDIAFAVTTNPTDAAAIQVDALPSLRLFLWNETHEFPLDADYTEDSVSAWLRETMKRPAHWLHLPGTKTTVLSPYLAAGPTLVVFTPGHPLLPSTPVFSMLRELSFRYFNCDKNAWLSRIADNVESSNRGLRSQTQRKELNCARLRQAKKEKEKADGAMTSAVIAASALTNRTGCSVFGGSSAFMGPQLEVCVRPLGPLVNTSSNIRYDTSMWRNENDDLGASALFRAMQNQECNILESAQTYHKILYPNLNPEGGEEVEGLACVNNKTLSFAAYDSLLHYQIAEGLGINILDMAEKTAVVIIDARSESHYVLNEELTENSLIRFVQNHTYGLLDRHLRSTHDWESRTLTRYAYPVKPEINCGHSDTESCVPELHSRNFLPTVLDPTKAVIVLYHSSLCAICRSVSHIFLLLSRYFRHFPSLRFARIDGERNDLPWRYNMETYPTILFFPTVNKASSRVFSDDLPFTVRTVMHFILANLEPEAKVPAMLSLCKSFERQQNNAESRNCINKIQLQIQDGLSLSLRHMRSVMASWASISPESTAASALHRKKTELMLSLQFFRSAGFVLGSKDSAGDAISEVIELYLRFLRR